MAEDDAAEAKAAAEVTEKYLLYVIGPAACLRRPMAVPGFI